ncbi:peptidase A24A prepilin type IV [Methylocella silvestris BL2]|uniref:Peptidase A24A prepilin type IV n=1 Tax=Methylocella silvestris (strain DSM 15510 / CIP 108128 / LMG 27833 / NCIMB 13906 / BL2) TaxID=395965 RepID=B8ESI8_METSB|nr:A24 family peptidase [Methylocella silvestris]ACK49878.1 peptidase A24A prepilin type IV [Methylocella silvestris BL2]
MSWRETAVLYRGGDAREGRMIGIAALAGLGAAAVAASLSFAPGVSGWFGAALALLTLAIAIIDARSFLIPNELSLAVFALALASAAVGAPEGAVTGVAFAILRACVLGLAFFALREVYYRWRGREGIGFGDVKLAAAGGAWLDWPMMPVAVEIAALTAIAAYALVQSAGRRRIDPSGRLPFGLFLAPAIWLGWLIQTGNFGF